MANQVMQQSAESESFEPKYRIDEEYEYYTELATNASQLWIESILRKRLAYQDDFRKSLEDGVVLCELLNTLRPGCIKKINRLPSKIAGIDNLTVFLQTCSDVFSLHEKQLFQVSDLDDLTERAIPANQLADEQGKRIRRVLTTVYYLAKAATGLYDGSPIDFSAFTGIVTPCPPSGPSSGNALMYNREPSISTSVRTNSEEKMSQSRSESNSPVSSSAKTTSAQSVARQNARAADQSPSRLSDAGSFDSNLSSNQGTAQKDSVNNNNNINNNTQNSNRTSQSRTSQAHHFVKSGFSLPTGPSNLTRTAVEQMRLISESRSSGAFQAPVARQSSLGTANTKVDEDAWQSDLDLWRMRRKQSLQSQLPAEVLQSVGMLDDGSDPLKFFDGAESGKKSNKKPGLLSKLRYSVEQDSEDPIVVLEVQAKEKKDSLNSLASSLREKLPPIADTTDASPDADSAQQEDETGQNKEQERGKEEAAAPQNGGEKSPPVMSTSSGSSSGTNDAEKDGYKDTVFTITQAPGNLRGFGFSIKGGRDSQMPLVIDRVTAGSAADEADVRVEDEIVKINNESVASHFRPTLNRLIQQCVKAGQISLTIRRYTHSPLQPQVSTTTTNEALNPPQKSVVALVTSNDTVDQTGAPKMSPRVGPGPLVMEEEIRVRSPEPPQTNCAPDESDQWLRSGNSYKHASSLTTEGSPKPPVPSSQQDPSATSPALSSSSSSSSSASNQQRVILGIPHGYRVSPGQQQQGNILTSSIKDESNHESAPARVPAPRSNGGSGAILVRGPNNSQPTTTINDQSPSANGSASLGRSPYHNNQSQIPQPFATPNSNSQNTAPPQSQQQPPDGFSNGALRNGSAKKENGVSREQAPQTPPQLPRSVSSRELCASCSQPLGAGPAMAIERLGLFYHVRCFRCSVCKVSLSNGQTGVDVRVKGSRLHCQNCNSSDESGLQSSQV